MFAITTIIKNADGTHIVNEGCLIRLPPELLGPGRIRRYLEANSAGWRKDDLGYYCYSRFNADGKLMILPALIVRGEKTPKTYGVYKNAFSKAEIEHYVNGLIKIEENAFKAATEDVNMLIHDLRRISASIYNSAKEAETLIDQGNAHEARSRIGNVMAAQQILKMRTDVLDFTGNPSSVVAINEIDIYRKTDKVCRAFKPMAQKKRCEIQFSGSSSSHALGPEVFEIAPYLLIDNAIKYCPEGAVIKVEVYEADGFLNLYVISLGPQILPGELDAIFERGRRGTAAEDQGIGGSGFGLFLLRELITKHFSGEVECEQGGVATYVNGRTYFETEFRVRLPTAQ